MDQIFEKNLITTKDAGDLSGYTPDYLARLARSGKIAGKRIGHSWFIDSSSFARVLDQQENHKINYARALARSREAEYRKHQSFLHSVTETLSKPPVASPLNIGRNILYSRAVALLAAFLVVVFGAYIAHSSFLLKIATEAATIVHKVAFGFNATFEDIPSRIALRIDTASAEMNACSSRVAMRDSLSSERVASPLLADLDFSSVRMAISPNASERSSVFAFTQADSSVNIENIQSFALAFRRLGELGYEFVITPSRLTNTFVNAYVAIGNESYATLMKALTGYRSFIENSGEKVLAFAATARDIFATAPDFITQMNLAFGNSIIETTHAAIHADVMAANGLSVALPKLAHTTLALITTTGDALAGVTTRAPALATSAYLRVTAAPATLAPALAQKIFGIEYAEAFRFVTFSNTISEHYLSALSTTGHLVLGLRNLGETGYASTLALTHAAYSFLAHAPAVIENTYLGALGNSAFALHKITITPQVATVLATPPALALRSLGVTGISVGEQVALVTYEMINSFGVFIQKGIAQFDTIIADQFAAATNFTGASSAGTVSILAGNTVAQVNKAYVNPYTKVFITFNSPIIGNWYVSDKQNGSFRVVLSEPQSADVSFDFFLVQTEGQVTTSTPEENIPPTIIPNETASSTSPVDSTSSPQTDLGNGDSSASNMPDVPTDTTPPAVTLVGDAAMQIDVNDTLIRARLQLTKPTAI